MILGKPKKEENYICVNSEIAEKLHRVGFIPSYREVNKDNIYFLKTEELCEMLEVLCE